MRTSGRITTGIAAAALLAMVNLGCAAKQQQPEITDTWTAAAQQANAAASRAEAAANPAETAASSVETAAKRAEDAAARVEATLGKRLRKQRPAYTTPSPR